MPLTFAKLLQQGVFPITGFAIDKSAKEISTQVAFMQEITCRHEL